MPYLQKIWTGIPDGPFADALIRGTLEIGKGADFAVLDRDIWGCSNEERRDVKVVCAVAGGTATYGELEE